MIYSQSMRNTVDSARSSRRTTVTVTQTKTDQPQPRYAIELARFRTLVASPQKTSSLSQLARCTERNTSFTAYVATVVGHARRAILVNIASSYQ